MSTINQIIIKYRNSKYFQYAIHCSGVILLYLLYQLYAWGNTESSDNAYLDAEISNIGAEISGVITNIFVLENTHIKQGDLIAEIDDKKYKATLEKTIADVEASTKNIATIEQKTVIEQINLEKNKEIAKLAKTNLEIAEIDYKRTIGLNKDNFASKKILDVAMILFEKAKSEYIQAMFGTQSSEQNLVLLNIQKAEAVANLESLIQERNIAIHDLNHTKIVSPINGVLSNNGLRIGNFVQPGALLFSIVPSNSLYIRVNFKETQIAKLKMGMQAIITFDSISNKKFYGKIRNLSPATGAKFSLFPPDNATGNFTKIVQRVPVLIDFTLSEVGQFNLVPGMSAKISIRTDQ